MKRAFGAVAAPLLAACSSIAQTTVPNGPMPLSLLAAPVYRSARPDRSASWMLAGAAGMKELLYLSDDDTDDVDVYDYPSGTQVGALTGFNQPNNLCVDKAGDVWVTNYGGGSVSEYAHGAAKALRTLPLGSYQAGCAIDPTTGDLAVTELYGLLAVFKHAKGRPKMYTSASCPAFWAPAYDPQGNLFAESSANDQTIICELPHDGKGLQTVASDLTIYYPAGAMWDGQYLAFGDQSFENHELVGGYYQASEDSSGGLKQAGATELFDNVCGGESDILQPFILGTKNTPVNRKQGTVAISTNYSCLGVVDIWAYPAGGNPAGTFPDPPKFPNGQAVSIKT